MGSGNQARICEALAGCPLYFILDESICGSDPAGVAREAVAAGARVMQLRFKSLEKKELSGLAAQLAAVCREHGCIFLVNDYLDVALESGADGVHLGANDLSVEEARKIALEMVIGGTARTPDTARKLEQEGADYLGCGSVFPSSTKPGLPVIGVNGISSISRAVEIPIVGIGGITLENHHDVMGAGAAGVCSVAPFKGAGIHAVIRQFCSKGTLPEGVNG